MTDNVQHLGPRAGDSVVSLLTDMLGQAQRGEITSIACAMTWSDKSVGSVVSRSDNLWPLIGAIGAMHWRMIQQKLGEPS